MWLKFHAIVLENVPIVLRQLNDLKGNEIIFLVKVQKFPAENNRIEHK